MINANELRIGNWLHGHEPQTMKHKETGYFQVESISHECINLWRVEGFDDEYATEVSPIPLSPEVLEKCGFESNKYACYIRLQEGYLYFTIQTSEFGLCIEYGDEDMEASIKLSIWYLHQLQNLYFALTSKELEITL